MIPSRSAAGAREVADQEFLCKRAIYAGRIAFQKAVCLRKTSLFWSGSACDALGNGDSRRRKLGIPAKILAERDPQAFMIAKSNMDILKARSDLEKAQSEKEEQPV